MAATLGSPLAAVSGGGVGYRRTGPQPSLAVRAVVYPLSSRSHIGSGLRFGNAFKLRKVHKDHRSRGFIYIQPLKANDSDSGGSDKPPLATILAGIVVFLLFLWLVSSVVLWIVGLIVNVPKP